MAYGVPWKYLWDIGNLYERGWEVQLGSFSSACWEKKNGWIPWASREKQAGLYQGKYKSLGPDVATGGCCQEGATLTDTQQSPVIPETCGSCKNNPLPPNEPLPLSSHTAQSTGSEGCVFSWGCPPWVWCMREWGCVRVSVCARKQHRGCSLFWCQGLNRTTRKCYWFRWDPVIARGCFSDEVVCQICPT